MIAQAPPRADELILLFHGVGATAEGLLPLAQRLARAFPAAFVASVPAPDASDLGAGRQWFSVRGVTEENRVERVAATLPRFVDTVHAWQAQAGVGAARTTLVGFSQGAIMALAASLLPQAPARRIVSLAGRFVALPRQVPAGMRYHFLHGEADTVIPVQQAKDGAGAVLAAGGDATLDVLPGLGHGLDAAAVETLVERLSRS